MGLGTPAPTPAGARRPSPAPSAYSSAGSSAMQEGSSTGQNLARALLLIRRTLPALFACRAPSRSPQRPSPVHLRLRSPRIRDGGRLPRSAGGCVPDQAPVASRWMLSKVTDLDAQVAAVNCTYAAASWSGRLSA